jgi:hypothetical protein
MLKNRLLTHLSVTLTGLVFLGTGFLTAEEVPDKIKIYNEGYRRKLYEPVDFPHAAHAEDYGIACDECHHNYQNGKNVWQEGDPVKRCIVCHNPNKAQGKVVRLVFAYHFKCRNCHRENGAGPVECSDCHTKKNR